MKKVLITGSSGFVGRNLIRYFDDRGFPFRRINLRGIQGPFELTEAGDVVHLAGKAHDMKSASRPDEYYKVNYELTKTLYDSFLKSTAKKFIFVSSVKASADHVEGFLKESDIPAPKTHYGKSKLMAEEYIQAQPIPDGKEWYILRPCMIHGPGNKGNLNLLFKFISKGIPYPLAAFENRRSFLSIENLCFVISEILHRNDISSGVYNVSDDEPLSTNELIQLMATASGKRSLLWKISPALVRSLAKLGDTLKLPLTSERLSKLTESYLVDNTKIRETLRKELPVKAREGIIRTVSSFGSQQQ